MFGGPCGPTERPAKACLGTQSPPYGWDLNAHKEHER